MESSVTTFFGTFYSPLASYYYVLAYFSFSKEGALGVCASDQHQRYYSAPDQLLQPLFLSYCLSVTLH